MDAIPFEITLTEASDVAFPYLVDILTFVAINYRGTCAVRGLHPQAEPFAAGFSAREAGVKVGLMVDGFTSYAISGLNRPTSLLLRCQYSPEADGDIQGLKQVLLAVVGFAFAAFIERSCDWIKTQISSNPQHGWPPISNFCRVVRNAIIHGGKVNINSATAPVVSWGSLSYDHTVSGREIIPNDLSLGDLLYLMFLVQEELRDLGLTPVNW